MEFSNTVKWKATVCPSGEECWCRMIEPVDKIEDDKGNEIYIAGSGEINKIHAEHIVKIHNQQIDRFNEGRL
jgi:hypothetical protein